MKARGLLADGSRSKISAFKSVASGEAAYRGEHEASIGWLHMPVPIDRDDEAYFAPLTNLLKRQTELYLGLVHFRDGLEGAARRIATARKFSPVNFWIAFECGLGRRPPDEPIAKFLELHREIATSVP
jgi:hypothetical protein